MKKIFRVLFMEKKKEPKGTEAVELKCDEIIRTYPVGSPEFVAAYAQLEKVKALKMAESKAKKAPRIDPAIIGAGIGALAQITCTAMIEKYNADGHLFPSKSITTNWLGLNGIWSKIGGLLHQKGSK